MDEKMELLPCPVCNGPAVNAGDLYITCGSPAATKCLGKQIKADLEDWNTRTAAPVQGERDVYSALIADAAKVCEALGVADLTQAHEAISGLRADHARPVTGKMVQDALDTFGHPPSFTAMKRALEAALQAEGEA